MHSRIMYEMKVQKSFMDLGHCECLEVNKDFFCSCSDLNFLDDSNIKCHEDELPEI